MVGFQKKRAVKVVLLDGWVDCSSCGSKDGVRPCGRKDATKGRKRRCRPTCAACKTYKRRRGTR